MENGIDVVKVYTTLIKYSLRKVSHIKKKVQQEKYENILFLQTLYALVRSVMVASGGRHRYENGNK